MNDERETSGPAMRSRSSSRSSDRVSEVFAFILPIYYLGKITTSHAYPPIDLDPGSTAVVEYSARHDGAALDALAYEYEPCLPAFQHRQRTWC
jgi:hypothetical protein